MSDKLKFPRIIAALGAAFGLKPEQQLAVDSALSVELAAMGPAVIEAAEKVEKSAEEVAAEQAALDAANEAAKVERATEIKTAVDAAVAGVHALYAAREAVAEKVGVTSLDSADATYRFALDKSGVAHAGIAADAIPALWDATAKVSKPASQDAALVEDFDLLKIFPGASYIRKG